MSDEKLSSQKLERKTKLHGKSLGGVISSLHRTKFRNIPLIEPVGMAKDGHGLRWVLNFRLLKLREVKKEVNRLVRTY